ncbi:MAG: ABC transporter ATP-binding protein/permease [Firmicutes bacterium]|nr:ABC transporter ATP-binding protein/permease [Bacillota bacterium]
MLQLNNIKKDYISASGVVHALKGINLSFRKSEFVSILGPSGCGKTTMLNLIGGLDKYTSGDLVISGRSTRGFADRDWDVYRNHKVGFIFQSYNLIPHQTVLNNVALALTIAGVSKEERVRRAKEALDKVGLSDKYYKKPNQLSGGQCQRVAIARALINDPEILLADEPTGALDSETSVQIMELIKEIAKERLVIMVTHNPDLAEQYSTRIIKLHDGLLTEDSDPYIPETVTKTSMGGATFSRSQKTKTAKPKTTSKERAKMSFFTAFRLSLNNLFTKKARTIVMSVASAIGIIGVSLVLAVSFGVQNFIGDMQNEMLAGNPIQINQTGFDMDAIANLMNPPETADLVVGNWVNVEAMIAELYGMIGDMDDIFVQNRIDRNYMQFLMDMPQEYFSTMHFLYGLNTAYSIFTDFSGEGQYTSMAGILATYGALLENIEGFADFAQLLSMVGTPIRQAPMFDTDIATDYLLTQFDIVATREGHRDGIAREKNEVMIVLGRDNVLTDIMLGQIGFYSQEEFLNIVYGVVEDDNYNPYLTNADRVEFNELLDHRMIWQPNNNIFTENKNFFNLANIMPQLLTGNIPFEYNPIINSVADGVELNVVGILAPRNDASSVMLNSGVYYTTALAEYMIYRNWDSYLIRYMRENFLENGLSGAIMELGGEEGMDFLPGLIPSHLTPIAPASGNVIPFLMPYNYRGREGTTTNLVGSVDGSLMGMIFGGMGGGGAGGMDGLVMSSVGLRQFGGNVYSIIERAEEADEANGISVNDIISWEVFFDANGDTFPLPFSISIFSSTFSQVDQVTRYLRMWNNRNEFNLRQNFYIDLEFSDGTSITLAPDDRERVQYTDMLSLIMTLISQLILIITIALVAFTALSLVVSSVMIGILTYVSVMERIKEIGVIRSLGGRKRDVSNLFTAETFILGLTAGVVGIAITYLLSIFINIIVGVLAGVSGIAALPWWVALIMIGISIGLTMLAGILPSGSAARKDPVVALRAE